MMVVFKWNDVDGDRLAVYVQRDEVRAVEYVANNHDILILTTNARHEIPLRMLDVDDAAVKLVVDAMLDDLDATRRTEVSNMIVTWTRNADAAWIRKYQ